MKKILVCDDDAAIREILGMVIESKFDNEILFACHAKEAIDCLKKDVNIGLIISDYNMPGGKGSEIFNYNSEAQNLPFFILTGGHEDSFDDIDDFKTNIHNTIIRKPWNEDDFLNAITAVLENCNEEIEEDAQEDLLDYKKVRATIVLKYLKENIVFYKKINDIEFKQLDKDEFENLDTILNEFPFVYIRQEKFQLLLSLVEKRFSNYKEALRSSSLLNIFKASEVVMDKLFLNAQIIDISLSELKNLSKAASCEVEKLKKEEEIKDIIENSILLNDYFEGHSLMTMQIAFKLTTSLGFADEQVIAKIIQASILHDSLFENEKYSEINTSIELKKLNLSSEESKIILEHGDKFADYFKTFDWISDDVITAIRQHHVRRDSWALVPSGNPDDIPTFSAIFNLSHQCADHIFKYGGTTESRKNFINLLKKFYLVGNFKFAAKRLIDLLS